MTPFTPVTIPRTFPGISPSSVPIDSGARSRYGKVSATSSAGMFAPPTGTTMNCLPPARYVIGEPCALAGRSISASNSPVALSNA